MFAIEFQFTHPGKGATIYGRGVGTQQGFQFTHPGKGATLRVVDRKLSLHVSIHAPWEGCDVFITGMSTQVLRFNSRTLGRVRPHSPTTALASPRVSIHAPWEGCDWPLRPTPPPQRRFNSRTLGRVRLDLRLLALAGLMFQFTHPGKGATHVVVVEGEEEVFQFTHPGKGATIPFAGRSKRITSFNSRTLGRVRLETQKGEPGAPGFQFTHPGKGATDLSGREATV